jgi:hypothetical protein
MNIHQAHKQVAEPMIASLPSVKKLLMRQNNVRKGSSFFQASVFKYE